MRDHTTIPPWETTRRMSKSARVMAWLDAHPAQAHLSPAAIAASLAAWGVTDNDVRQARHHWRRGRTPHAPMPTRAEAVAAVRAHGAKRRAARALGLGYSTLCAILGREEPRP